MSNLLERLLFWIVNGRTQRKLKEWYEKHPDYEYDGIHDLPWEKEE